MRHLDLVGNTIRDFGGSKPVGSFLKDLHRPPSTLKEWVQYKFGPFDALGWNMSPNNQPSPTHMLSLKICRDIPEIVARGEKLGHKVQDCVLHFTPAH